MTDLRGNQYLKTFQRRVAEESKQKQFLAQPMPIVQPFQPERSKKPLTEVQPFVSHTSSRVEQRKHFDDEKTRRQKELEREEMEQAAAREVMYI